MLYRFKMTHPDVIRRVGGAGEFRVWIPEKESGRNPDVAVVLRETSPDHRGRRPPSLVAEVVSRRGEDRDDRDKREEYRVFGIRESWIVDPMLRQVLTGRPGGMTPGRANFAGRRSDLERPLAGTGGTVAELWNDVEAPDSMGSPNGDRRPLVVVAYDNPWGLEWAGLAMVRARLPRGSLGILQQRTEQSPGAEIPSGDFIADAVCVGGGPARRNGGNASLLITNEPELTYRCGLMARAIGLRVPQVAWAFNYAGLPRGRARVGMLKAGFRSVDRFVISSSMERELYSDHFGIPPEKFDLHLWSVGDPGIAHPEVAIERKVHRSVGGNPRLPTRFQAMALLPKIRLSRDPP